jgi:hypothetical protein
MIKIIITSIILFIIFIIILLSLNVKIEYFNSGSNEPVISGDYITDYIDVDNIYYMFRSGTSTFTISSSIICDILVVGGGGGGGTRHGGGGGAGALIYEQNKILNSGTYIITIGTGGSGGNSTGAGVAATNGRDTSISLNGTGNIYLAKGGGFGGSHFNGNAVSGGSGGGNGAAGSIGNALTTNIPVGTYGNSGNVGGTGGSYPSWIGYGGGGGGGAETRGGSLTTDNRGYGIAGSGGNGKLITIRGINEYFAGGGGGGISAYAISGGKGGLGGGGDGTKGYIVGNAGQANTGGGGGGSGFNDQTNAGAAIAGGAGGSGVVIIRINKKTNSYIDNSSDCPVNLIPSGEIKQVPDTNMNISVISTITKLNDNTYNQAFGNGNITYTITFSKYFNDDYVPTNLFLRNNKTTAFAIGNYNNGIFIKNNVNIGYNSTYTEKGEYIHIRLPSDITLKRYGFKADKTAVPRAPGSWALYTGNRLLENTNVNKQLIVSNSIKLDNNSYCQKNQFTYIQDIQTNNISGNELLFIFPSLAGSANVLSFLELLLFSS